MIALPPDRKELGVPSPGRSAVRRSHSFAGGETLMTAAQALIYGIILSWVPSIVLLAWLLWQERVHLNERRKDWRNRF